MNKLITMLCVASVATVSFADDGTWFTENKTSVSGMTAAGKTTDGTWSTASETTAIADQIFAEGDNVGFETDGALTYTPDATMKGETATVTFDDIVFGASYDSTETLGEPDKTALAIVNNKFYVYGVADGAEDAAWNDTGIDADPDAAYDITLAVNGSQMTYTIGDSTYTVAFAGKITDLALKGSGSFASMSATKAFADFNLVLPDVEHVTGWKVGDVDYVAGETTIREGSTPVITAVVDSAYNVRYIKDVWQLDAVAGDVTITADDVSDNMTIAKNPAKIGDTYYDTLDKAIAAALANENDNQEIELCDNVTYTTSAGLIIDANTAEISKHMTLNVGNYNITCCGQGYGLVIYGVELTVKGTGSIIKNNVGTHVCVGFSTKSTSEIAPKIDSTRNTPVYGSLILNDATLALNGSSNSVLKISCGTAKLKSGKLTGTRPLEDDAFTVVDIASQYATLDFADFGCDVADVKKWFNEGTVKIYDITEATQAKLLAEVAGKFVAGQKLTGADYQLQEGTVLTVTDPNQITIYDDYAAVDNTPAEADLLKWGKDFEAKTYAIDAVLGFAGTIKNGADVTVAGAEKTAWLLLQNTTLDGTLRIGANANFSFLQLPNEETGVGGNLYLTPNGKFYFQDDWAAFRSQWMSGWGLSSGCEILPAAEYADNYEVVYKDGAYQLAEKTVVAKIGDKSYATLAAAVEAANADDVVVVQADITLDSTLNVNKAITIDFGGKVVTLPAAGDGIKVTGNATLKNGTLNSALTKTSNVYALHSYKTSATYENLTIDGANYRFVVYAEGSDTIAACYGDNDPTTTVTCKNVDVKGNGTLFEVEFTYMTLDADCSAIAAGTAWGDYKAAIYSAGNATVTIAGGTYTHEKALLSGNLGGKIVVNGGIFNGSIYSWMESDKHTTYHADPKFVAQFTLNAGTFNGAIEFKDPEARELDKFTKGAEVALDAPEGYQWNDDGILVIKTVDPFPEPKADDDPVQEAANVADALTEGDFSDAAKSNITTKDEYDLFKNYCQTTLEITAPGGTTGNVKDNAYLSYALDAGKIDKEITAADVTVDEFTEGEDGNKDLVISIAGVTPGAEVSAEKIASVVEITANTELDEAGFAAGKATVSGQCIESGKIKVSVKPADGEPTAFFYKTTIKK